MAKRKVGKLAALKASRAKKAGKKVRTRKGAKKC